MRFSENIQIMRIALLALPCAVSASAETLTGAARIIDADTVEIAGEKLRLEGIDAPESRPDVQACREALRLRKGSDFGTACEDRQGIHHVQG